MLHQISSVSEQPIMASLLLKNLVLLALLVHLRAFAADSEFKFDGFRGANLSLDGIARLSDEGLLLLTNRTQQSKGQAFYPSAFRFKTSESAAAHSFSTTFVFAIVSEYPTISSFGFTFCLSPTKALHGGIANFLGLFNSTNINLASNHIVAVEFDTVETPEYKDIDDNHVGIDIYGLISNNSHTAGYYTGDSNRDFHNLSLVSGQPMQAWVEYDGKKLQLNVTIAPLGQQKPSRPLLSSEIDLSGMISEDVFIGFTASEGNILTTHYILGWSFKMDGNATLDLTSLPKLPLIAENKKKSWTWIIWLSLSLVLALTITGLIISYIVARRMKFAELREEWEQEYGPHRFSYKELFQATEGFKDKHFLGFGGFGSVYKGVLPSSKAEVAVKKISHQSRQGMKEFVAEIVSLGRLRHRNLVRLLGYCRREGELFLVYDFMHNGSLDKHLFCQRRPCLDWNQRFRIIKGVASGLLYLHEEWVKVVIHRDIKASNVLLDSEFNARLGDFGLARLYDHGTDFQTTHVMGTMGYLAPELVRRGKATTCSDVYAFGVFLLEVACGKRPIELEDYGEEIVLVEWVLECWKNGDIGGARDRRLGEEYVMEEMELVLKLGLLCCHPVDRARPSMRQVMHFLNGDFCLPQLTPSSLNDDVLDSIADEGFDKYVVSSSSSASLATASLLSGGR
ncbi:Non-specific serine/threonine protein kinase protein [Dioscorea alata]|uniref:Non-specific serine/threonine protein kinase protein n=1 Tax=Dioscorea alata TaxID=55571 RepID=A0ACB7UW70_DIOAL|nr:Non-specific serine/threonine protein kinase protein [Dioscorea alata]